MRRPYYINKLLSAENPASDGGNLVNTVSATWTHPVVITAGSPNYMSAPGASSTNDGVARVAGEWSPNQECFGIVGHIGAGWLNAELELHVLMTMLNSPDRIFSYEWDIVNSGNASQWVRWDGQTQLGQFTVLGTGGFIGGLVSGDVLSARATVSAGSTLLEGFLNGTLIESFTDSNAARLSVGNPGVGFDNESGTDVVGFTYFGAMSLTPEPSRARVRRASVNRSGLKTKLNIKSWY